MREDIKRERERERERVEKEAEIKEKKEGRDGGKNGGGDWRKTLRSMRKK